MHASCTCMFNHMWQCFSVRSCCMSDGHTSLIAIQVLHSSHCSMNALSIHASNYKINLFKYLVDVWEHHTIQQRCLFAVNRLCTLLLIVDLVVCGCKSKFYDNLIPARHPLLSGDDYHLVTPLFVTWCAQNLSHKRLWLRYCVKMGVDWQLVSVNLEFRQAHWLVAQCSEFSVLSLAYSMLFWRILWKVEFLQLFLQYSKIYPIPCRFCDIQV